MALSGSITVDFNLTDTRTVGLAAGIRSNPRVNQTINLADGVGSGQANKVYGFTRALVAGVDTVDLAGVLADAFGGTLTLARVKGIVISNPAGNGDLTVGGGTNAITTILGATGTITIKPNGMFLIATDDSVAYAITAGTADLLKVAGTGTQSYTLGFVGCDA